MASKKERHSAIAAIMRNQQSPDSPPKHEWLELLTLLCRDEDQHLREIGISELRNCADQATHVKHA